jgi:dTDP-4-dehydrorhamnose reductase
MSKRYLIIGGNGLVGKSFRKLLKNDEVFYTSREASGAQGQLQCDLLDRESIRQAFEASRPDV